MHGLVRPERFVHITNDLCTIYLSDYSMVILIQQLFATLHVFERYAMVSCSI